METSPIVMSGSMPLALLLKRRPSPDALKSFVLGISTGKVSITYKHSNIFFTLAECKALLILEEKRSEMVINEQVNSADLKKETKKMVID